MVLVGLAAAVSYFGQDSSISAIVPVASKTPRQVKEYGVFYKVGVFGPTNIRIHVGDSVKFENNSFTAVRIVSDGTSNKLDLPGFDSKIEVAPNQSFSYVFQKAGIFGYHNFSNPDENGSVVVRP